MKNNSLRFTGAARPLGMSEKMADAFADLWRQMGITHELTISPGLHARPIKDGELHQLMRRMVRKATCKLRGVPRRRSLNITKDHPDVLSVAGFLEPRSRFGCAYLHWHGGVALRDGEDERFRQLLQDHVGVDASESAVAAASRLTARPLLRLPGAEPTFHLKPLVTPSLFIRYANKQAINSDFQFFTTPYYLG